MMVNSVLGVLWSVAGVGDSSRVLQKVVWGSRSGRGAASSRISYIVVKARISRGTLS